MLGRRLSVKQEQTPILLQHLKIRTNPPECQYGQTSASGLEPGNLHCSSVMVPGVRMRGTWNPFLRGASRSRFSITQVILTQFQPIYVPSESTFSAFGVAVRHKMILCQSYTLGTTVIQHSRQHKQEAVLHNSANSLTNQ